MQPDLCVTGAGSAGLSVASIAAGERIEGSRLLIGAHAGEPIMPWVLAMSRGLKVSHLASLIYPYPTLSEATRGAAVEFLKPAAQNPWVRRPMSSARRLG